MQPQQRESHLSRPRSNFNLYSLSDPTHGGYVTFNAHLLSNLNRDVILKVGKKFEDKPRPLGWGKYYQNVSRDLLIADNNFVITTLEKSHYDLLPLLQGKNIVIITHDTVEFKNEVIKAIKDNKDNWKIITIRQQISDYLKTKHDIDSTFVIHPFHVPLTPSSKYPRKNAVSISRVDYDKHTEIIIEANKQLIKSQQTPITIYGLVNRMYAYQKLDAVIENPEYIPFHQKYPYYKRPLHKSFGDLHNILTEKQFVVDMSVISNDGGGTQYTFLEAIHYGCVLILNSRWKVVESESNNTFIHGYNCLMVDDATGLVELLTKNYKDYDLEKIRDNARKILDSHKNVDWNKQIVRLLS